MPLILVSCFAKLQKFRPNFDFVFREISRNSRKISQNTKIKISQNYENEHFRSHPNPNPISYIAPLVLHTPGKQTNFYEKLNRQNRKKNIEKELIHLQRAGRLGTCVFFPLHNFKNILLNLKLYIIQINMQSAILFHKGIISFLLHDDLT